MGDLVSNLVFQILISLSVLPLSIPASAAAPLPEKILQAADRARGGLSQGLSWKLQLISKDGDKETSFEYDIRVKDNNVLAKCLLPPRSKGEVYLFLDRNLWVHRPGLRKPLSLSSRQRLSGQVANGDIATTNYARDYTPTLSGEEIIDGIKAWKLKLKAKSSDLTYDQINYWVSQDKNLGLKAEFLTIEGELFKSAQFTYLNSIKSGGKSIPFVSKMVIVDAKNPKLISELIYSKPDSSSISSSEFNVSNISQ